jgi:exonuclease VII small subunit
MKTDSKTNINERVGQLDKLIAYFEASGNDFNLDEGIKKYEEAIKIVKELKTSLKSYEIKIRELDASYQEDESGEE